jgi:hypothetical protein
MSDQVCPDCGAILRNNVTCQQQFETLLFLEYEYPECAGKVHHLMVMCYMLQHNRYSDEAAALVVDGLEACVKRGMSPSELRVKNAKMADSSVRRWKVIGSTTLTRHIRWPITILDINSVEPDAYCATVNEWTRTTLDAIRARQAR